jgi:smad nuclear-interacting protein 1
MFGGVDLESKLRKKEREEQKKSSSTSKSNNFTSSSRTSLSGVSCDEFIYGSSSNDTLLDPKSVDVNGFRGFSNFEETQQPKRRFDKWSAPKEFLDEAAEIIGRNAEDPFEKHRVKHVADRENDYTSRWRKRKLSPDRVDAFSSDSSNTSGNKRTYAEIYMENELDRQKSDLLFKLRKKEEDMRHKKELEKTYGKETVQKAREEEKREEQRIADEQSRKRVKHDHHQRGDHRDNRRGHHSRQSASQQHTEEQKEEPEQKSKTILKEAPNFKATGVLNDTANRNTQGNILKWVEPSEARVPDQHWRMYIMKEGKEIEKPILLYNQKAYRFGRDRDINDIPTDHPSCSKQHAAICFRSVKPNKNDDRARFLMIENTERIIKPFLIDLSSTHGTLLNGKKIDDLRYVELRSGDAIGIGHSTREYILINEDEEVPV